MRNKKSADGPVAENLRLPWRFRAARGKPLPSETALAEGLAAVGLEEVGPASDARSLSSGQTQRVALLRGMLLRPDFLLLDEPTANLDGKSARLVWEAITRFRAKSGAGVLCATHLRKAPAASRALIFKNGALTGENPK